MSVIATSIIIAIAALVGFSSYYIWGPDNRVEESCEKVIEIQTGEDIDLSPETPENPPQKVETVQEGPKTEEIKS